MFLNVQMSKFFLFYNSDGLSFFISIRTEASLLLFSQYSFVSNNQDVWFSTFPVVLEKLVQKSTTNHASWLRMVDYDF